LDRARPERLGYSIAALRRTARRCLPRMVRDSAEEEFTRRRDESGFADRAFLSALLNDRRQLR
jgi:hypothetical protein